MSAQQIQMMLASGQITPTQARQMMLQESLASAPSAAHAASLPGDNALSALTGQNVTAGYQGVDPNWQPPQQAAPAQQQQPGFFEALGGLPGNPMFNMGMGLLAAGYDRRINPWAAASQGLNNAAVFKYNQDEAKYRSETRKAEAERRDEIRKAGERLLNVVQKADADGVRTSGEDQEIKREALQYQILTGDKGFTEMLFQPKKIPGSTIGQINYDRDQGFVTPEQADAHIQRITHIPESAGGGAQSPIGKAVADFQKGLIDRTTLDAIIAKATAMPAADREQWRDLQVLPQGGVLGIRDVNKGFEFIPGSEVITPEIGQAYSGLQPITDPSHPNFGGMSGLNNATGQWEPIPGSEGMFSETEAPPAKVQEFEYLQDLLSKATTPDEQQAVWDLWNRVNGKEFLSLEKTPEGTFIFDSQTGEREQVSTPDQLSGIAGREKLYERGYEAVAEFREDYQSAKAEIDEMKGLVAELIELNELRETGLGWFTSLSEWELARDKVVQQMNAKFSAVGLKRIKEFGLAPTSDTDVSTVSSLAGSITNWGEANDVLLEDTYKSLERMSVAQDATLDWYDQAETNLPTLPGMARRLNSYVERKWQEAGVEPNRIVFITSQDQYDSLMPGTHYYLNGKPGIKQ